MGKERLCRSTTALPQEQILNCIGVQNVSLWNAAELRPLFFADFQREEMYRKSQ